jgi:hypothetical protein
MLTEVELSVLSKRASAALAGCRRGSGVIAVGGKTSPWKWGAFLQADRSVQTKAASALAAKN